MQNHDNLCRQRSPTARTYKTTNEYNSLLNNSTSKQLMWLKDMKLSTKLVKAEIKAFERTELCQESGIRKWVTESSVRTQRI
jgi:hypothetical protein